MTNAAINLQEKVGTEQDFLKVLDRFLENNIFIKLYLAHNLSSRMEGHRINDLRD